MIQEYNRSVVGHHHPKHLEDLTAKTSSIRLSSGMEQTSFGELGRNIISLAELAALGKWEEAEALHAKTMRQVDALKRERLQNHSAKIRKSFHECSCFCGNLLASVLTSNGRWQQVELILTEVWLVAKVTLHESNQDVLKSISNVTNVLARQGNWQEAEKMCRKNMQICQRCFEKDHRCTLISKSNLATVLQEQGKWQLAEEMHREVLEAERRVLGVLGESHADTLISTNNLATVLQEQGKWQEAEEMHREAGSHAPSSWREPCGHSHQHEQPCHCPPRARQMAGS